MWHRLCVFVRLCDRCWICEGWEDIITVWTKRLCFVLSCTAQHYHQQTSICETSLFVTNQVRYGIEDVPVSEPRRL